MADHLASERIRAVVVVTRAAIRQQPDQDAAIRQWGLRRLTDLESSAGTDALRTELEAARGTIAGL